MQTWHEILGHSNYEDVRRLQSVVNGTEIKSSTAKPAQLCEICTEGKLTQTRNREPDRKATESLQLVHTDLAGPMRTPSLEGHNYSGAVTVHLLKIQKRCYTCNGKVLSRLSTLLKIKMFSHR